MAGTIASNGVLWNVGDTSGRRAGETVDIPGDLGTSNSGDGEPSGAPSGSPFYVDTATNKLYAWTGSAWVATSGANS